MENKDFLPKLITSEIKTSFLDYAMSVIVARALPDARDGLKPVHRRIIYAMNDMGMTHDKPYKKSARIVGDVIAKYHPHGDQAVYDALVRMAQDFSMRYVLVDGHGNFGSVDGDDPAAMRYTESRMSKLAAEMVRDINKNTVDFGDNYDGEEHEPLVLPARFPNLLINGSSGIAVGMATNIPPHNLREVIDGVLTLARNPEVTIRELMDIIPGPDFPTAGIIMRRTGIYNAYQTGNGSFVIRSRCHVETMSNGKPRIIVTEIPYQVNKATMVEKIADLVKNKIIEGITDLRDESNREGIRVVIELRKDIIPDVMLNHLYKLTPLQVSYGMNTIALVNGEPRSLNLKDALHYYLEHQFEVVTRRTQFELEKAADRLHILEGLVIANTNIDDVIHLIRNAPNPKEALPLLMSTFALSEKQAKAILEMQLQRLTGIEVDKINNESADLRVQITGYQKILGDRNELLNVVETELKEIREKFGDDRKSEISSDSEDIEDEDLITQEDIVISLTTNGYFKRTSVDTYRSQHRGGKGIKGMTTNEDDVIDRILITNTHRDVLFFSNLGKVYRLRGHRVPEQARQAKGIPAINLLSMEKGEVIKAMLDVTSYDDEGHHLVFVTKQGIVKRTDLKEYESIRQNGKIALSLRDGDELLSVLKTTGTDEIILVSSSGRAARFDEDSLRALGRNAIGVKGMNVEDGEVIGCSTSSEGPFIFTITENGYGKMTPVEDYRKTNRNAKGVTTHQQTDKTGVVIAMKAVNGDEDIIVMTDKGVVIRTTLTSVRQTGRNAQGVRVISLNEGHKVATIAITEAATDEAIAVEPIVPVEIDNQKN